MAEEIVLTGWNVGFTKIECTKLLQRELGYSLTDAKAVTDAVLAGQRVRLPFTGERRAELASLLVALCVRVDAAPPLPQ